MSGNCRGAKLRTTGWKLLALALGHVPAKAEDSQVKRGPTPAWVVPSELMPVPEGASGMLFVRRQHIVAHPDDQGQAQYLGYRKTGRTSWRERGCRYVYFTVVTGSSKN